MTDNVPVTPDAEYVVASDDDGTAQHQYVKLEFGADNTQTKVSSADPLPVVQTGTPGLPTGAATAAAQASILAAVDGLEGLITTLNGLVATAANQTTLIGHVDGVEGKLDTLHSDLASISGFVDGVEALLTTLNGLVDGLEALVGASATEATLQSVDGHVDGLEGGLGAAADAAATAGGTGSVTAKLRLATSQLDSIQTAVETIDNAISGSEMQVDVLTLPELPAGTNNIGDVDVASSALPAGAATEAKQDTLIGHVDGVEGLLATIDADTGTIAGAVAGSEMQVDIVSGSVGVSGTVTVDSELTTADLDTGAGTDTRAVVGLVGSKSGGGALIPGDATAGLKVDLGADNDVTVTGSVTANAGTNLNTSALALESGGNLAGAATSLAVIDDWDETDRAKVNPIVGQAGVQGGSGGVTALTQRVVLATDVALPAGTNAIGKLAANSGVDIGDVDVTSVAGTVTTKETRSATGTTTQVSDNAASTTILASNANRIKAIITNDSSARLFLRFSAAAASTTNYTVSLAQHESWEECDYTGEIRGIWESDPNDGAARVTEFT